MLAMEKDVDPKLRVQGTNNNKVDDVKNCNSPSNGGASNNILKSKSFSFRAPQENFSIEDFELGKIYGVGSYSKVSFLTFHFFFWISGFFFFIKKIMFDYSFIFVCIN